eukprot:10596155-Heterocapsa_arctica.AAC.1
MPVIAIVARRSCVLSAASVAVFAAGSEEVSALKPKAPLEVSVPGNWSREVLREAAWPRICPQPAAGT